jgi:hypothetical protein
MSSENHWPGVWDVPVENRVEVDPSMALSGGLADSAVEDVATQPARGSTVNACPAGNAAGIPEGGPPTVLDPMPIG